MKKTLKVLAFAFAVFAASYFPINVKAADTCSTQFLDTSSDQYLACEQAYQSCAAGGAYGQSTSNCSTVGKAMGDAKTTSDTCLANGGSQLACNQQAQQVQQTELGTTQTPAPTSFAQPCSKCNLSYTPLEPLPYGGSGTSISLGQYLFAAFKVLIVAGGLMAVLAFVIAGISYMVSDVVNQKEWARSRMQSAVWGLILLLASWLILDTINPQLLTFSALNTPLVTSNPPAGTPTACASTSPTAYSCYGVAGSNSAH